MPSLDNALPAGLAFFLGQVGFVVTPLGTGSAFVRAPLSSAGNTLPAQLAFPLGAGGFLVVPLGTGPAFVRT
jgi:hypothetical protein